jgi:hypothetical protein
MELHLWAMKKWMVKTMQFLFMYVHVKETNVFSDYCQLSGVTNSNITVTTEDFSELYSATSEY